METVQNVVNTVTETATKAIWGDQSKAAQDETTKQNETGGQEPVSGVTGAGTADEPFDQGNREQSHNGTAGREPVAGVLGAGTASEPFDKGNEATATTSEKTTATGPAAEIADSTKIEPISSNAGTGTATGAAADIADSTKLEPIGSETAPAKETIKDKAVSELTAATEKTHISKDKDTTMDKPSTAPAAPAASNGGDHPPMESSENNGTKKTSKLDKLKDKLHLHGSSKHA